MSHWANTEKIQEIVKNLVSMGLKMPEVASVLGVNDRYLRQVRKENPELDQAVKDGREALHNVLCAQMVLAATGYDYEVVRKEENAQGKLLKTITTTRKMPPSPQLFMFLMSNRWPERWKIQKQLIQKKDVTHRITAEMEGKKIDEFAGKLLKPVESEVIDAQV